MISWYLLAVQWQQQRDSSFPSSSRHTQSCSYACCHAQTPLPALCGWWLRELLLFVVTVVVWICAAVSSCVPLPGFRSLSPLFSGGCNCFIPPPSQPTWLMRQAVPIDVTRLGFVHKIFLPPPQSNQLAAVLDLLNEWTQVNELAMVSSLRAGPDLFGAHMSERLTCIRIQSNGLYFCGSSDSN